MAPRAVPVDMLAEARLEMCIVLAGLQRTGAQVLPVTDGAGAARFARGPVRTFRIDGNDVQIYLIAHDDDSSPEAHLSPRLAVPRRSGAYRISTSARTSSWCASRSIHASRADLTIWYATSVAIAATGRSRAS